MLGDVASNTYQLGHWRVGAHELLPSNAELVASRSELPAEQLSVYQGNIRVRPPRSRFFAPPLASHANCSLPPLANFSFGARFSIYSYFDGFVCICILYTEAVNR